MSDQVKYAVIESVSSTHQLLAGKLGDCSALRQSLGELTMLRAKEQTAGRGQRGNSWESLPGKNLTFSMYYHPAAIPPAEQFIISEAFALAIADFIDELLVEAGVAKRGEVKWPNDIYVGDRKICGILIEHRLSGAHIEETVLSAGVNINQPRFLSDAPNPVSLMQLTGKEYDLDRLSVSLTQHIRRRMAALTPADATSSELAEVHEEFKQRLWRREGMHPYREAASGETFEAAIADVGPDGLLTLRLAVGTLRTYRFKEIAAQI